MLLRAETSRDDAAMWFEAVINQMAMGARQIFAPRYGKLTVGYMILKPSENKISSIYVDPAHRGKRAAEGLYGLGVVSLGTPYPYTVFVHDMLSEFQALIRANQLVLDDTGPLCVLNPGDDIADEFVTAKGAPAPEPKSYGRNTLTGVSRITSVRGRG